MIDEVRNVWKFEFIGDPDVFKAKFAFFYTESGLGVKEVQGRRVDQAVSISFEGEIGSSSELSDKVDSTLLEGVTRPEVGDVVVALKVGDTILSYDKVYPEILRQYLMLAKGEIRGASELSGISVQTYYRHVKKYGIPFTGREEIFTRNK